MPINVIAFILYIAYLFVPGFVVLYIAGCRRYLYLLSFSTSFSLLILTQIPFRIFGGKVWYWMVAVHGIFVGSLLVVLTWKWLSSRRRERENNITYRNLRKYKNKKKRVIYYGFIISTITYAVYHLVVGAYTEVPADFWYHLVRIKWEYLAIEQGNILRYGSSIGALVNRDYVHSFHALVAYALGVYPYRIVTPATLATSAIFLGSIYWFSVFVFSSDRSSAKQKAIIATLATLFTILWFGVNVFSFIRYYAMAPAILNYVVFLTVVVLVLDYLNRSSASWMQLVPVPIFMVVMLLAHVQEALFTSLMVGFISLYSWWHRTREVRRKIVSQELLRRSSVLSILVLLGGVILMAYSFSYLEMNKMIKPYIIEIDDVIPFIRNLYILNPWRQFYHVLTVFGVAVYLLYFATRKRYSGNYYINVGMFMPLLTVFNPIYVLLYLRYQEVGTLWRMSLLMPINFVAASMVPMLWSRIWKEAKMEKRFIAVLTLTLLLYSLLPAETKYYRNPYSKLHTLLPINARQTLTWLEDLGTFLNTLDGNNIITDPVTSYVLRGMTHHSVRGWKFYGGRSGYDFKSMTEENGIEWLLKMKRGIIVINRRDGPVSINGALSRHWGSKVLKVSGWYPDGIETLIKSYPDKFHKLWKKDQVTVYNINR